MTQDDIINTILRVAWFPFERALMHSVKAHLKSYREADRVLLGRRIHERVERGDSPLLRRQAYSGLITEALQSPRVGAAIDKAANMTGTTTQFVVDVLTEEGSAPEYNPVVIIDDAILEVVQVDR